MRAFAELPNFSHPDTRASKGAAIKSRERHIPKGAFADDGRKRALPCDGGGARERPLPSTVSRLRIAMPSIGAARMKLARGPWRLRPRSSVPARNVTSPPRTRRALCPKRGGGPDRRLRPARRENSAPASSPAKAGESLSTRNFAVDVIAGTRCDPGLNLAVGDLPVGCRGGLRRAHGPN